MAFLDIERIINQDVVGSRFKLVHLAGLRAKELNNPTDETFMPNYKSGQKVTSRALADIVCSKVTFTEIERTVQEEESNGENGGQNQNV